MSYVRIWVHAVWSTKKRAPFLKKEIRNKVFIHIKHHANMMGYHVDYINGVSDHVHCLLLLREGQNLSDIMMVIKGESSHWINESHLIEEHFGWQNDYYAVSTCISQLKNLRQYIKNQEQHHQSKESDFEKELQELNMKQMAD